MKCREKCGACCIEPSIARPFYGMPSGKAAGQRCVHLDVDFRCELFGDPRRPQCCAAFVPGLAACGDGREQALLILAELESLTLPAATLPGGGS